MITSRDISTAVTTSRLDHSALCTAFRLVLPVLRSIRYNSGGWKFWVRPVLSGLIAAIEAYVEESCH